MIPMNIMKKFILIFNLFDGNKVKEKRKKKLKTTVLDNYILTFASKTSI